ncbi:MAG: Glu-tRNA(Gln) amidotransferase subunit GatD [Candidatus Heimdallarchaeota archaeon]|nr:Glu-tRNA(Gln) amidotransferase subunit GatD [Candidatus Heimdallarchaeota archaeon]
MMVLLSDLKMKEEVTDSNQSSAKELKKKIEKKPMGYKGELRERLIKEQVGVWSEVRVKKGEAIYEGVILPRSQHTAEGYLVLKVDTGYNIGVKITDDCVIEEFGFKEGHYKLPDVEVKYNPDLPNVTLLGTGGTVASRLDYRTGAVLPAFTPEELFSAVPELMTICNLTPKKIYSLLSENFQPEYWVKTAEAIMNEFKKGADGVIIGHGTDTMSFTGSALSFFFQELAVPIVIVGSQRSSDRPSSDGPLNIINASTVAGYADLAEVVICMHGSTSDSYNLIHRGTRVRKMHSSRRDAFRTLSDIPLGIIDANQKITFLKDDVKPRGDIADTYIDAKIDPRVAMLYFYPGMDPDILHSVIDKDYHGVVFIGTGLGHVNTDMYPALERAQEEEIPICIVVEPLYGFTNLRVYETGRDMLARGIFEGGNMLPCAAYAKMIWTLGHTRDVDEVKKIMTTNIAGEITKREPNKGYLLMQGVEPGIEELLKKVNPNPREHQWPGKNQY